MLVTFCNTVLMPLFPPIYLYSCSSQPLCTGMFSPYVFCCCLFSYFDLILFYCFFNTCETSSIKIWCLLATRLAEILTQVVFHQPLFLYIFIPGYIFTNPCLFIFYIFIWCLFIFSSTWNQFVIFDVFVFALAAFVLFRDLSHKNAWINHTIPVAVRTNLDFYFYSQLVCYSNKRSTLHF